MSLDQFLAPKEKPKKKEKEKPFSWGSLSLSSDSIETTTPQPITTTTTATTTKQKIDLASFLVEEQAKNKKNQQEKQKQTQTFTTTTTTTISTTTTTPPSQPPPPNKPKVNLAAYINQEQTAKDKRMKALHKPPKLIASIETEERAIQQITRLYTTEFPASAPSTHTLQPTPQHHNRKSPRRKNMECVDTRPMEIKFASSC
jgi:hypothetical protein